MENTVEIISKGKGSKKNYLDALLEINGQRFGIFSRVIDYKPNGDQIFEYFIQAAWHHNQSNQVTIGARTLRGLVGAIRRYEFKLVKYQYYR